jgi:hypothetical protein
LMMDGWVVITPPTAPPSPRSPLLSGVPRG